MLIDNAAAGFDGLIGCRIIQRRVLGLFWWDIGKLFFSQCEAEDYIKELKAD